ncbi:MAG: HAD family hydrolase, partial [Gemmatimonadetes bacterium]|nr:HAD family hydrolase [Gemmatimonadota bacterium]
TIYVICVLTFAAAGFLAWSPAGADRALAVAVSILVVTCPCALGLATPLAQEMVSGSLRRRGIFLREGSFADRALSVRKILFDKTGTLTLGRTVLHDEALRALETLDAPARQALARLAAASGHPVSRAVSEALPPAEFPAGCEPPREFPGQGVELRVGDEVWRFGSPGFTGAADPPEAGGRAAFSRAVLSRNGQEITSLPYGEELRADAVDEVRALTRAGFEIHLLSGDSPGRTAAAARRLGIPAQRAHGHLSPENKARQVAALDHRDTLMVGDGLNDSLSFQAAWTSATPAIDHATLPARADFYFLGGGIGAIRTALAHARRLRTVVRDNLILSTAYNLAALSLCFAGLVTPVVAAVLMPVSSAVVVTLTASRLRGGNRSWK